MSWQQLWIYFSNATNDIKYHIWNQIELSDLLPRLTPEDQYIVLEGAPMDILNLVYDIIHPSIKHRGSR